MSNTSQIPLGFNIADANGRVTQPWAFWFQSTGNNSTNGANNVQVGLQANLPSAPTNSNSVYLAYDSGNTYVSNGTSWTELLPVFTGDVYNTVGSNNLQLSTVNKAIGTFGDPNNYPVITVDSKGRITNVSLQAVQAGGSSGGGGGGSGSTTTLVGDVTGVGVGTINTTLSNTTVVPGTYTNATVTVDSKGRVISATSGGSGSAQSGVIVGNLNCGKVTEIVTARIDFGSVTDLPNVVVNLGSVTGTIIR
jgi:hypothetical protein